MHDPLVVAWELRRPWPRGNPRPDPQRRWGRPSCGFATLAGRRFYFPSLVTVWHREPGGADALSVCRPWRTDDAGKRQWTNRWRWHVHHWKLQVQPLQALRRRLLTRCAWCGQRSGGRGDVVNVRIGWDGPETPWWKGEQGLRHAECSSAYLAWNTCTCVQPDLGLEPVSLRPREYGRCQRCGRQRAWNQSAYRSTQAEAWRARVPEGMRPTARTRAVLEALHRLARARGEVGA